MGARFDRVVNGGGFQTETLPAPAGLDHSWYANAFAPIGYVNKKAPKDYLSKLDKIILVRANMLGGSCQGRLVSTEIMYSKE